MWQLCRTRDGSTSQGLNATETQELRKFCIFPRCKRVAAQCFHSGAGGIFTEDERRMYKELKAKLMWNTRKWGPLCFCSGDSDRRHSLFDAVLSRQYKGKNFDRTELPQSHTQHIQWETGLQSLPTAARVPDSIQLPIECCFSIVKPKITKKKHSMTRPRSHELAKISHDVCKQEVTQALVESNFKHALKAIAVFSGRQGESIQYKRGGQQWTVHCTDGDWVPKIIAG